jgi:hypothetical protein
MKVLAKLRESDTRQTTVRWTEGRHLTPCKKARVGNGVFYMEIRELLYERALVYAMPDERRKIYQLSRLN